MSWPEFLGWLDTVGFDIGGYHLSLLGGFKVLTVVIGITVIGWTLSRLVRRLFRRMTRLDLAQQVLGEKLANIALWTALVLFGVDVLGINLTALTVFSGAFGLAIGFGLQKTLGNLISGIILLMDRSIEPGDVIAVGTGADKTVGKVNRIGIRAVAVTTRDHIKYLIPNEVLMTSAVENWTASTKDERLKVPVRLAYGNDLELAERLMLQAVAGVERVQPEPKPAVWLVNFAEKAIEFEIQVSISQPEIGTGMIRSAILRNVWHLFRDNGVALPVPPEQMQPQ
ncbi:mechanosensitive ion channel [Novosphingobium sp. APW14]|jgi:small-conductance mechanosensitive channel|uniref:mechanosensitive ion channel family protein n=1 Tax=Novosphingobium sp. APW14 TaxID=3077237 RepID=UPI0028DE52FF|nr:mechanosensitive ion channel domain-containing protein [Novosphingobium sp. APW14]MDT9013115.1 mechanosensitive ion channel [Novosphingobium sp. APW14]